MSNIDHILKTRIENDAAGTCLIVVPTASAVLERQRELVGYHPNRAVANLRVHDIENVVRRLYDYVEPARRRISQGVQNLWFREIANLQPDAGDASVYEALHPGQGVAVPDSTLSLIVDTINRLRERGETAQHIGGTENPTTGELVRIYGAYEARLKERWIDEQGIHLHLANNFKQTFMQFAFPGVDLVVVEGFTVLSRADIRILTSIAEIPEIEMWFRTDCVSENEGLYKNITDLVTEFKALDVNGVNIDTDYGRDLGRHQHLAENIFSDAISGRAPNQPASHHGGDTHMSGAITLLKPADRSEEVEQIAHLIQKHVADGDCKLSEICVVYYNVGQYLQRIAETFPAYGIPYSLIERVPLTKSEVIKAIFSRLSTSQTPLAGPYFSDTAPESNNLSLTPKQFQEYVNNLLNQGEVIRHILNPMLKANSEIVEGEIEAYRQFSRILKELCNVLIGEGVAADSLSNYVEKLHHIAKHTNYQSRPAKKGEAVDVVQMGELRSLAYDTVFLGDFVEGKFPEDYRPDPLLPETPYRTEDEKRHDDRFMFYRVLRAFRQRLYLLTPGREAESDLIPSPFLEQLKTVMPVAEREIGDPTQGSRAGFLSTYGGHVWAVPDSSSGGEFPPEVAEMRPCINRVIEVEKSREDTHDLPACEGQLKEAVLSAESREALRTLRGEPYSATDLEIYAKCPFQYFVQKVLKLSAEEEEPEDELSSLDKGTLLHKVLYDFYKPFRKQGQLNINQWSEAVFAEAAHRLNGLLDSEAEKLRTERASKERASTEADNLFWETDVKKLRVTLQKWLEAERACTLRLVPYEFERAFGTDETERRTGGGVRLKGKIDRIDVDLDRKVFNVIDYKTGGAVPKISGIRAGQALQLPIYLQMAAAWLREHKGLELQPAAALYYKIRLDRFVAELGIGKEELNAEAFESYNGSSWKGFGNGNRQLLDTDAFHQLLERVSGYVEHYVDWISEGTFPLITRVDTFVDSEEEGSTPLTPRDKTAPCSYCQYKRSCRVGAISEVFESDD